MRLEIVFGFLGLNRAAPDFHTIWSSVLRTQDPCHLARCIQQELPQQVSLEVANPRVLTAEWMFSEFS